MKQRQNSISQRSRRDSRLVMRSAFEDYEKSLYPNDNARLARCKASGEYLDESVRVGYTDWKKAWNAAIHYAKNGSK